jgi:2-C-methyl-D-erythritol 4-phosphate cytidylyltransferase
MGVDLPKVLLPLGGTPMLVHTLRALAAVALIGEMVVAVAPDHRDLARRLVEEAGPWPWPLIFALGGAERQNSVAACLDALSPGIDLVAIHDGARPLVPPDGVTRAIEAANVHGAALLAVPSRDTVKTVDANGVVTATPPRESMWLAQTPQVFRVDLVREAHARARREGIVATDDAALVERLGAAVYVVLGGAANLKITTPEDLRWAEWYLQTRADPR